MASSRDDFIIAIRSAFLKKSTQQKFSLLTLVLISTFVIVLSSLNFKAIKYLKIGINEVVYRSSFIVSVPENFIKNTFFSIVEYSTFFKNYKQNQNELEQLKSKDISNEIIQYENKELKNLIITKEKELILLSEQNENLKNNIRLLKENLDNENADILNEEEIILNELETNEEPN